MHALKWPINSARMVQLSRRELKAARGLDERRWKAAGLDEIDRYQQQLRRHQVCVKTPVADSGSAAPRLSLRGSAHLPV